MSIIKNQSVNNLAFVLLSALFLLFNTVFDVGNLYSVPLIGGIDLSLTDILIAWLLALAAISRMMCRNTVVLSPLSKYVAILFGLVLVCGFYSIIVLDQPPVAVFANIRVFIGYTLYFPVVWCLGSPKGVEKVIKLWAVLAVLGALLYIYMFYFGEPVVFQKYSWLYSRITSVDTGGGTGGYNAGYQRMLSQGSVLFRIMLFVAISMWIFTRGRFRKFWALLALLLAFQVVLQFTRGMYLTSIFALLVMIVIIRDRRARVQIWAASMGMVFVAGLIILYRLSIGEADGDYGVLGFAKDRLFRVITHGSEDQSVVSRLDVFTSLPDYMNDNWLFGLGLGRDIIYSDNTYISLLFTTGLVGLLGFAVLFTIVIFRGYKGYKYLVVPWQKAVVLGLWISTLRHLVNGLTQADFTLSTRVPALIVSVALMEVLIIRAADARREDKIKNETDSIAEPVEQTNGA